MSTNKELTPLLQNQQQIQADQLEFTPQQLKLLQKIISQKQSPGINIPNSSQPNIIPEKNYENCITSIVFSVIIVGSLIGIAIYLGTVD
jgi:hypothetical protein